MSKSKKKFRFLKGLLIFVIIIVIIVIILGFLFPGLIWTRSLGINYTQEDYESVMNKLEYIKDEAPIEGKREDYTYTFGQTKEVNVEFTSEEISAFFNENRPDYYAVKNVQVRVNDNGTIDTTGSLNVDYILNEFLDGEFSREEIQEEIPALGFLPSNVNVYFNFEGSVTNNKSNPQINKVEVQGIPIPSEYSTSSDAISRVTSGLNGLMSKYNSKTGSSFKSIKVEDGKIKFNGEVPSSLERIKND